MSDNWTSFSLDTPRDHAACRSWFNSMIADDATLLYADGLDSPDGERTVKLCVLVRKADGSLRQFTRKNLTRSWSIDSTAPTPRLLKAAKQRGAVQ